MVIVVRRAWLSTRRCSLHIQAVVKIVQQHSFLLTEMQMMILKITKLKYFVIK